MARRALDFMHVIRQLNGRLLILNRKTLGFQVHQEISASKVDQSRSHYSSLAMAQYCDTSIALATNYHLNSNLVLRRFKKKGRKKAQDDEEEDENDDDDLTEENPLLVDDLPGQSDDGAEEAKIDIGSFRLDAVCKTAFGISRAKVEELYYKGNVYINGERPNKKSVDVGLNDEIDLVLRPNAENPGMVDIKRAIIISVPDKTSETGRIKLGIKRWQSLMVEDPNKKIK